MHWRSCLVALAGLCGGAAAGIDVPAARAAHVTDASRFASAAATVEVYRAGVSDLMEGIDPSDDDRVSAGSRLQRIRHEVYPALIWAAIRADAVVVALTSGRTDGAWGWVFEPDHPALARDTPTLRTLVVDDKHVMLVRPDRMSQRWAGVFMVHEMSHVLDAWDAATGSGCSTEFNAYTVEREAFDHLTSGGFTRQLDAVIAGGQLASYDAVTRAAVHAEIDLRAIFDGLETALGEAPSESLAEREMRDGFYLVSLADRIGETSGLGAFRRCEEMAAMINKAGKHPSQPPESAQPPAGNHSNNTAPSTMR